MHKCEVEWPELIPIMKKQPISYIEIKKLFTNKTGKKHPNTADALRVVDWISYREPVYEVCRGIFKILTSDDLDKYEAKRLEGVKHGKRNDMAQDA